MYREAKAGDDDEKTVGGYLVVVLEHRSDLSSRKRWQRERRS